MEASLLSPKLLEVAKEIIHWAQEYLMKEEPLIMRPSGSREVCPFVAPSVTNNTFYLAFHPEVNGVSVDAIEQIMLDYRVRFLDLSPFAPQEFLKKALLVIFPEIPHQRGYVLDRVHSKIKGVFVNDGLMVGQFHPKCEVRGIYNPAFPVSRSPYALIAIRHMAIHDVLFLHENKEWFNAYNLRFGEKFKDPSNLEDRFVKLYSAAKEKFSR